MAYSNDGKTLALYDLDVDGENVTGDATWDTTAVGDGTFTAPANFTTWSQWVGGFTVEREVRLTADVPGTILELGGWGETEAVNIQVVVGWDSDRRMFVGWEREAGVDYVLVSDVPLPLNTDLRVAVTYAGIFNGGRAWIAVNGEVVASGRLPYPTGGDDGNGPTPGMTFAIGRRVSTSDPIAYTSGGWLRISLPRTIDEVIADWDASYSPPVPTGLSWEELAKRDGSFRYVVFRGRFRADADSPGEVVVWGTHGVHEPLGGFIPPRLAAPPSSIVRGVPETLGAVPERVSTTLTLNNTDGALDEWFAGGDDPETAHIGDSMLNLTGHLYEGRIGPDGVPVEMRITPRLVVFDAPQLDSSTRTITLQMASDDSPLLGPPAVFVTVDMLRAAAHVGDGQLMPIGRSAGSRQTGTINADGWDYIRTRFRENRDQTVPWGFGVAQLPLVFVGGKYHLAAVTLHEPTLGTDWQLCDGNWNHNAIHINGLDPRVFKIKVRVDLPGGGTLDVWLVGVEFGGTSSTASNEERAWVLEPSRADDFGVTVGSRATPARVLRQVIEDLASDGSPIDTATFVRLERELRQPGICGGHVGNGSTIAEVASHICDPFGVSAWVGTDDNVRALRMTGWGPDDAADAMGDLPHIVPSDVMQGSVSMRQPAPTELGGASKRTTIEWTSEQRDFYKGKPLLERAPGRTALTIAGDAEARISGAWVYAPRAELALSSAGTRRAFVFPHVSLAMGSWIVAHDLGELFRLTHPFLDFDQRLVRLIRIEYQPGDDAALCTFLDVGALANMKVGLLDSAANWIFYDPEESGETIEFTNGSAVVACSDPAMSEDWTGRSLWTFGASNPDLRRSWRIDKVEEGLGTFEVVPTPTASEVIASDGADAHRAAWIVMRNRSSDPTHRPEYITVADATTAQHTDGSPSYKFGS